MSKISQKALLPPLKLQFGRKSRIAALLIVFTAVLSLVVAANKWNSNQYIKEINIVGAELIEHSEILDIIAEPVINRPKENIRLVEVEVLSKRHPYILSSNAVMQSAGVLKLEVKERKPVAVVVGADGDLYYSDEKGALLPYRLFTSIKNLPVLANCFPYGVLDTAALKSGIKIIENLKNDKTEMLDYFISEIKYNNQDKTFSIITCESDLKIFFGKAENIARKLDLLALFCGKRLTKIAAAKLKYIDLRWENQIVTG